MLTLMMLTGDSPREFDSLLCEFLRVIIVFRFRHCLTPNVGVHREILYMRAVKNIILSSLKNK